MPALAPKGNNWPLLVIFIKYIGPRPGALASYIQLSRIKKDVPPSPPHPIITTMPNDSPSCNTQQVTPLPGAVLIALCVPKFTSLPPSLKGKATVACLGLWVPKVIMNHVLQAPDRWILLLSAEPAQPEVPAASCLACCTAFRVKGQRVPV